MEKIKVSSLRGNPANPRTIKDESFHKLVNNILRYPKFLSLRPIVHLDNIIQGGNMRHKAIKHIVSQPFGWFSQQIDKLNVSSEALATWNEVRALDAIPIEWTRNASSLTDDELRAFVIIDNNDFGDWNTEQLANEWDIKELLDWGTEIPGFKVEEEQEEEIEEQKVEPEAWFLNIRCEGESHAQELYERFIGLGLDVKIVN